MKPSYLIITLLLAAFLWAMFLKPSGHDQQKTILEANNKALVKQLDSAYLVIYESSKRETDFKASQMVLRAANEMLLQEAETSNKLYQREKKRKTGLLTDSLYTVAIDSLYPGR